MKFTFWLIAYFTTIVAFSQEKATFSFDNKSVAEVLFSLEKTYKVRFSYSDEIVRAKKVSFSNKARTLRETLNELEEKTSLQFKKISERYIIVKLKKNTLNISQNLKEIVLDNYLTKGISKNKKGFYTLIPKQLDILPGLIEADVLESIQLLPGVISPNETATGFVVRGGTSDQNRIIWDGINIYHNGHLFGMISAFNPSVSQKIIFHNKGTNPRFGERVSSVIDIKSNGKIASKLNSSISFNGISANIFVETPLIDTKLSVQLSARRSYTDLHQSNTYKKLANKVFESTKIKNAQNTTNDFYFIDYNLKLNYKFNENNTLLFSSIVINNKLDYLVDDKQNNTSYNDLLEIKNEGYSLLWEKKWNANFNQKTILSFSKYKLNYNYIQNTDTLNVDFNKRNVIYDSNFLTEFRINTNRNNYLNLGYQYSFKDVGYAFINTANLSLILDSDKSEVSTHAFFSNYSYKNTNLMNFEAGFRVNYYTELDAFKFEPRILIYKNITDNLKIQVTGEIKNQIINQIDETVLSDLSLENRLWRLADNKKFPIINSKQVSTGFIYNKNGWSVDLDTYYKKINGLTALSLGYLNPDGKTFRIGKQKIMGTDLYIKKDFNQFKTWISYSLTNVKSKFANLNNNIFFVSNTSITHTFSTSLTYKFKRIQSALGWKWHTGKPFTKSISSNNQISFEGINTERLPNYHRLDFSSTYLFEFSKKNAIHGKIGFSIRNLYNKRNQLSREYTGFNNINDPIEVTNKFSLGFTPNFLFKVYW